MLTASGGWRAARGKRRTREPQEGAGEPKIRTGEARKTREPCTWEAETREPPPFPSVFPFSHLPRARRLCPRARFSVLVPDGVQGVLAVPAKKVQAPETSGCRHYTEVVSAKFSVLVPDGVQGVPAVPAEKVQVPETSGCRHYTEVVSAKH